jgi:hypothetical protein
VRWFLEEWNNIRSFEKAKKVIIEEKDKLDKLIKEQDSLTETLQTLVAKIPKESLVSLLEMYWRL